MATWRSCGRRILSRSNCCRKAIRCPRRNRGHRCQTSASGRLVMRPLPQALLGGERFPERAENSDRGWLADAEPAGMAAAHQALHMLDLAPGRGFHEGEIEPADIGMRFGQRMEDAVVRLDLHFLAMTHRQRLI